MTENKRNIQTKWLANHGFKECNMGQAYAYSSKHPYTARQLTDPVENVKIEREFKHSSEGPWAFSFVMDFKTYPINSIEIIKALKRAGKNPDEKTAQEIKTFWDNLVEIEKEILYDEVIAKIKKEFVGKNGKPNTKDQNNPIWRFLGPQQKELTLCQFNGITLEYLINDTYAGEAYFEKWSDKAISELHNFLQTTNKNLVETPASDQAKTALAEAIHEILNQSPNRKKETLRIYLQKGRTQPNKLLTPGVGTSANKDFWLTIDNHSRGWFLHIRVGDWETTCGKEALEKRAYDYSPKEPKYLESKQAAVATAELILSKKLNRPVKIEEQEELYAPEFVDTHKIEFQRAWYDKESQAIRSKPEGKVLIQWTKGQEEPQISKTLKPEPDTNPLCQWKVVLCKTLADYRKGLEKNEDFARRRAAWLASEYRKYGINA